MKGAALSGALKETDEDVVFFFFYFYIPRKRESLLTSWNERESESCVTSRWLPLLFLHIKGACSLLLLMAKSVMSKVWSKKRKRVLCDGPRPCCVSAGFSALLPSPLLWPQPIKPWPFQDGCPCLSCFPVPSNNCATPKVPWGCSSWAVYGEECVHVLLSLILFCIMMGACFSTSACYPSPGWGLTVVLLLLLLMMLLLLPPPPLLLLQKETGLVFSSTAI